MTETRRGISELEFSLYPGDFVAHAYIRGRSMCAMFEEPVGVAKRDPIPDDVPLCTGCLWRASLVDVCYRVSLFLDSIGCSPSPQPDQAPPSEEPVSPEPVSEVPSVEQETAVVDEVGDAIRRGDQDEDGVAHNQADILKAGRNEAAKRSTRRKKV